MSRYTLILGVIVLYAVGFRLLALDRPFQYDAEGSGCLYGILARNYLRFDWTETHGMPVLTVGHIPDAPIVFYPDHPPLIPLLIVPVYALFGVGEWQTRLPTSIATVTAVFVLYLLLARVATRRIALIATSLFAAMPMTLYFGGFPEVVGMPLILFILLSVMGYLHFHEQPGLRTFLPFVGAFTLAALCDWPAFIIVPVFLAHFLATRRRRDWPWIVAFCLTACAIFVALYVYIALATHLPWYWMAPLFTRRSGMGVDVPFTLSRWLAAAVESNRAYQTLPLLLGSSIWLVVFGLRIRRPQPGAAVARILLGWGILHVVIGRLAVYTDEWWWSPLTPGIAVAAALLIDGVLRAAEHRRLSRMANGVAALLITLFALWTGGTTFRRLYPVKQDGPFTPMELGQAIQAAAPGPNDLALIVGGEDDAQLWFYGDRPLRTNIWTIEDVKRRVNDESAELVFSFDVQPWKAAGAGLVFPRNYRRDFGGLWTYLQQHYPLVPTSTILAAKFDVFDLRHPLAGTQ